MSVREFKNEAIHDHDADALLVAYPEDFSEEERMTLEVRYPGWVDRAHKIMAHPKVEAGQVAIQEMGSKKELILFACLEKPPKAPGYRQLVSALKRVVDTRKTRKIQRVAVAYPGVSQGRIHPEVMEDILRAACQSDAVIFDFYSRRED